MDKQKYKLIPNIFGSYDLQKHVQMPKDSHWQMVRVGVKNKDEAVDIIEHINSGVIEFEM